MDQKLVTIEVGPYSTRDTVVGSNLNEIYLTMMLVAPGQPRVVTWEEKKIRVLLGY